MKNKNNAGNDKQGAGEAAHSRFRKMLGKAKDYVKKVLGPDGENKESNKTEDRLEELLEQVSHTEKYMDGAVVSEELQKSWLGDVRFMVTKGFHDGIGRQYSDAVGNLSAARAGKLWLQFAGSLDKKEEQLTEEASSVSEVLEGKRKQAELHRDYQNYLQHHNKFNERGNTRGEFWLYLICGIIIFLADIPLAAEMLKYLYFVSANSKAITLNTLGDNLGTFMSAIGIGLSSIYIKIWYDEFVAKKYGHTVISKKKFEELFHTDDKTKALEEPDKKEIKRNELIVKGIKISLLLFTLGTIAMLGIFRGYAWMAKGGSNVPFPIVSVTLISITLLFSIVSGVCLSVSLNALTNYRRLKNCKKEGLELEKTFVEATKELAVVEGQKAYVRKVRSEIGDAYAWKRNIFRVLVAYYRTGFDAGMTEPGYFMQGLDYFDRVVLWREKFTAKNMNQQIAKP